MLAAADAGADLVVASRYVSGGSAGGLAGLSRHLVSRAAGAVARVLFHEARQSTDPLSGFFLCRRRLIDGIEFRPVGFKILLELLVCVPGLRVVDVPLRFQARAAGSSKASARQGLLFLRHLTSLFLQVDGSARIWKFALVGVSGLGLFLPSLWALSGPAGVPPLLAFLPAFALSFGWNALWNQLWTFADQRRRPRQGDVRVFLTRALLANLLVMYPCFALLGPDQPAAARRGGARGGGGDAGQRAVQPPEHPPGPHHLGSGGGRRRGPAGLSRLARAVSADRAVALPPDPGDGQRDRAPPSCSSGCAAAAGGRSGPRAPRTALSAGAASTSTSYLLLPVIDDRGLAGIVVCERRAARPFDASDLETGSARRRRPGGGPGRGRPRPPDRPRPADGGDRAGHRRHALTGRGSARAAQSSTRGARSQPSTSAIQRTPGGPMPAPGTPRRCRTDRRGPILTSRRWGRPASRCASRSAASSSSQTASTRPSAHRLGAQPDLARWSPWRAGPRRDRGPRPRRR